MVIRHRAIHAEHKQERHDAILDAAERLLLRSPERLAHVAEVADEARLAKGTVYLYFPSKEELLLALHERSIDGFFRAVIARVERKAPVSFDDMLALTRRHLVEPPLFLPLASRCFGLMAQSIPKAAAAAFRQRMSDRLERAGRGLERHFPELGPGGGVQLLRHCYAEIIGLWQMSAAGGTACGQSPDPTPAAFAWRYDDELERALRALWRGAIGGAIGRVTPRPRGRTGAQR
jgi:AcrR family transcriptional regulator